MEQALYHPADGYYGSGVRDRAARRLLHERERRAVVWKLMAGSCENLGKARPARDFVIVEQGAHTGNLRRMFWKRCAQRAGFFCGRCAIE